MPNAGSFDSTVHYNGNRYRERVQRVLLFARRISYRLHGPRHLLGVVIAMNDCGRMNIDA